MCCSSPGPLLPKTISGARASIARAFASEPQILFADEPTGSLDEETGEKIIELLFEVNRESHTTLVLVTHDMALAKRCDRVLCLHGGQLQDITDQDQESTP